MTTKQLLLTATAALPTMAATGRQAERPNILLIVVDDMGYSDMGCYGGEISTPNLDQMAARGVRFTQFYNSGRSCPSRAQLLTGCYAQTVGITGMGLSLTRDCVTVPEVLRQAGYHTYMAGKWHLSLTRGIPDNESQMRWLSHQDSFGGRPFAPIDTYPCNRGFEEHIGTIWGVVDHFDPFSLVHNEEPIYTDHIPQDFYSTDFITTTSCQMLDELKEKGDPFFLYVSYNAPHWPLHAKPEDIAKYKGRYDEGWDVMRRDRYRRMTELGIIDPAETPNAPNASGRPWAEEKNKAFEAANMEVHAAMIDCVDQGVGRIIERLKANGQYDNTIIMFTSDNGASSENYTIGEFDRHDRIRDGRKVVHNSSTPGNQLSYNYLSTGWAGAVNAPYRYWKRESFHGGTATPFIVQWPAGLKAKGGSIIKEPCQYLDFMPTCIELAHATYPTRYADHEIQPLPEEAQSIMPLLTGKGHWRHERTLYWEHENGKAIRDGHWRLTCLTNGSWQLFDLSTDLSESTDVAAQHPAKVKELKAKWNKWARSVGLDAPVVIEEGKAYTISCRGDEKLCVTDDGTPTLRLAPEDKNSLWTFVATGRPDCYYIKNLATGRYAAACATSTGVEVGLSTTPVEYKVVEAEAEGTACYGITSTNLTNTTFTNGCIGWNWRDTGCVQTYAAAMGTNHRSFWRLREATPTR